MIEVLSISTDQEFDMINKGISDLKSGLIKVTFDETDIIIISVEKTENISGKKSIDIYFHLRSGLSKNVLEELTNLKLVKECHCLAKFGETYEFCYRLRVKNENSQDDVSSFIIYELYKNGVAQSPNNSFASCSDLVKALTEDSKSGFSYVVGLIGELIFLDKIILEKPSLDINNIWYGYERSNRDFVVNDVGIEVKTTTSPESKHSISSLKQVTPCNSDEEITGIEKALLLLSISLVPTATTDLPIIDNDENILSLKLLYISIKNKLNNENLQKSFFDNVTSYLNKKYSSEIEFLADLDSDRLLRLTFKLRFLRFYDMYDFENIKILRDGSTINDFIHVDAASVKFVMSLPNKITEDNPLSFIDGIKYIIG